MCVSGFTYNFVLQNQFLHRKFYAKNQKTKNAFLDHKKTFLYKTYENTPGTAGGPGGRDRTLAVKSRKSAEKSPFFLKKI